MGPATAKDHEQAEMLERVTVGVGQNDRGTIFRKKTLAMKGGGVCEAHGFIIGHRKTLRPAAGLWIWALLNSFWERGFREGLAMARSVIGGEILRPQTREGKG